MIDVDVDYISKYFNSDVQSVRSYLGVLYVPYTELLSLDQVVESRFCGRATEQTS